MLLHHICHKEIHATLTEAELVHDFDAPEKLRAHPHLKKFTRWLASKPPDFDARTQEPAAAQDAVMIEGIIAERPIDSATRLSDPTAVSADGKQGVS